jgi:D-3-phosphoglycerate dehydrogenase / 2-oxoglutarate reductase
MRKVLIVDEVHPVIKEELTSLGLQCDFFPDYSRSDFIRIIHEYYGIILRSRIELDREMLSAATMLKFIGRVGSGMESIDVAFAGQRGIHCLNSPEGNRDAVGEHALGMLLSLMNHICRANRQVKQGKWIREGNRGTEIKNKTTGIIGYGNMGGAFAMRLQGFGSRVISYDKYKTGYSDAFTTESTLEEIFETADILSLHVPLTKETRYLVDDDFLAKFRKNIWLVNTSRGGVVNTKDLVKHLKAGKVLGAALDVMEYEDSSFEVLKDHMPEEFEYLRNAGNVLLTPHIAGWTVESKYKLAKVLVDKIKEVVQMNDKKLR